MSRSELELLAAEVRACQRCGLARSRQLAVPGEGPAPAELMLIGEGPGWNENQQGRPFVGAAGKFLEELLASIGLQRTDVYITNIVKCWPPGNRDPLPDEVVACADFLSRQIALVDPLMIVTLGRHSMARFRPNATIGRVHGTTIDWRGRSVFAMYHPAAALHQQSLRQSLLDDIQKIPPLLETLRAQRHGAAAPPPPPAAQQLPMF